MISRDGFSIIHKGSYALTYIGFAILIIGNFAITDHIAAPSITMIALLVIIISYKIVFKEHIFLKQNIILFLCFASIPILYLLGMLINSEGYNEIVYIVQIRTIIVGYSFIFLLLNSQRGIFYLNMMCIYIFIVVSFSIYTIIKYLSLLENIKDAIFKGNDWYVQYPLYYESIPFGIYHHFYSFFIVTGYLFCIYVLLGNHQFQINKICKILLIISSVWLTIFLHILASRTGLLFFYLITFYYLTGLFKGNKITYKQLGLILLGIIIFIVVLYQVSPVLRFKAQVVTDYFKADKNDIVNVNDDSRIKSFQIGIDIIKENIWTGTSYSKADSLYKKYYQTNYPNNNNYWLRPHNLFLAFAADFGLPLGILLLIALILPILILKKEINELCGLFYTMFFIYSLYDSPFNSKEFYYFFSFWAPFMIHYSIASKNDVKLIRKN